MQASEDELTQINDVGAVTARFIVEWFSADSSSKIIQKLRDCGVNFECHLAVEDTRFSGMTFVLTGALTMFTREEASEKIELFGGKVSGSVSKKTSYVIVGENAGSKEKKAKELGISILSEEDFLNLIQ